MLIPLRGKGSPKFHINKVILGKSIIVILSFVLVTLEIFECFGPRTMLYLSMCPACIKGSAS
jgi:hypothetical protein